MRDQPSIPRYSLRTSFIGLAFVGLGLLALMRPFDWVLLIVNLAVSYSIVFALVSALASTGSRRLVAATYAATALTMFLSGQMFYSRLLPDRWVETVYVAMHAPSDPAVWNADNAGAFCAILDRLCVVVLSTVAAYIIPWLVQRGNMPPHA